MVMITLTYRPGEGYKPNHIKEFMLRIRALLGSHLIGYAWIAEMMANRQNDLEALHYHVLLVMKKGKYLPKPDQAGLWPYGDTRIEQAKTPFYIVKYSGKEYQKHGFPVHARIFGLYVGKDIVSPFDYWRFRLSVLPSWLIQAAKLTGRVGVRIWRNLGGGWVVYGDPIYKSPWVVVTFGG